MHRAIVLLELDDVRRRREARGKIQDVVDSRRAEGVDRLRVVADDADARAIRLHRVHDLRLQRVRILILVDQHVLEARADLARDALVLHEDVPVQQQVVVVEQLLCVLDLDVAAEELCQLVAPVAAPGEHFLQRARQRLAAVDAVRVDREARVLARKALLLLREAELLAQKIQQVGGVAAVEHRERRLEADHLRVLAQQAVADRMVCAGPEQASGGAAQVGVCVGLRPQRLRGDALRPAQHLLGGAAREGQQQDSFGRDALEQQVRDAMRERIGLARAGAGDDQQRTGRETGSTRRAICSGVILGGIQALGKRIDRRILDVGVHVRAMMAENCI